MVSPVFERGMSAHLKGRNRFLNMWMHDVAARLQIRRKALARDAGLDDSYDVGTYPPEQTLIQSGGPSFLKTALVTAAMIGLGGAGALSALSVLPSSADPLPAGHAVETVPAATATEFDITIETVDGALSVTGVKKVE